MIVSIWRHGEAGSAVSDRQRELTGEGEDDVGFACHQFCHACEQRGIPSPGLILHSAWVRTTQTADILAAAFTHAGMRPLCELQPGSDIAQVDTALSEFFTGPQKLEHVALVSHQPLVSHLVDHYLGDAARVPSLPPGGLVTLDMDVPAGGCAKLLFWALPPEYEARL
jgi:phosphohistidine phosphatase